VPAMGGCDRVDGTAEPSTFLCLSKIPKHGKVNLTAPFFPGRRGVLRSPFEQVRFGGAPFGLRLFLLIPLGAAVIGGIRAARPTRSGGQGAAAGAVGGVGSAALAVGGCFAAALSIRFYGGQAPASLTVIPDPVAGGLFGLLWGVGGGAAGGFLGWRAPVRKAAPPAPAPAAAPAWSLQRASPRPRHRPPDPRRPVHPPQVP